MKLKTGDKVRIISGKDKGKEGTILQVFVKAERVVVEGANLMKKHLRAKQGQKGQVITFPSPLHFSNVLLVSGKSGKMGRVGYKFLEKDGRKQKIRVLKTKGAVEDIE